MFPHPFNTALSGVSLTSLFSFFFSSPPPRVTALPVDRKKRSWHISSVRDDISTSYVSHLKIAVVSEERRPNNSDPVFCRERRAQRISRLPLIAKTTTLAYVSGMSKRDRGGRIPSFEFAKSSNGFVPSHSLPGLFFFQQNATLSPPRYRIVRSRCVARLEFDSSLF